MNLDENQFNFDVRIVRAEQAVPNFGHLFQILYPRFFLEILMLCLFLNSDLDPIDCFSTAPSMAAFQDLF